MFRRKKKIEEPKPQRSFPLFEDEVQDSQYEKFVVGTKSGDQELSYVDMSFEDFEMMEMKAKAPEKPEDEEYQDDKIFGNAYNQGDVQLSRLAEIKVRGDYAAKLDCYNSDSAHVRTELTERCEKAFLSSEWSYIRVEGVDDKFPKQIIPYVFKDIYQALDDGYTSTTDRFIAIAELLRCSYEKVYQSLPVKIKERLLAEMDSSDGTITGQRIVRLF